MPTAIITGISGQDGSYLAELLISKGYRVVGLVPFSELGQINYIDHIKDRLILVDNNLLDQNVLNEIVKEYSPDEIYNLAAQSFEPACWERPVEIGNFMAQGVTRILEAIHKVKPAVRFFQASSSEMFGEPSEIPQTENTPLHPLGLYGFSKTFAHWMVGAYRQKYGIFACSGILYNHESPRRREEFVTRKITSAAVRIKFGLAHELRLGNLDACRDWGFAGDYVRAMWLTLQQSKPDDYIIATGQKHTVREFCDAAFKYLGLNYEDYVVQDPQFMRSGNRMLVGNPEKAHKIMNWKTTLSFVELVQLMVEYDINHIQK